MRQAGTEGVTEDRYSFLESYKCRTRVPGPECGHLLKSCPAGSLPCPVLALNITLTLKLHETSTIYIRQDSLDWVVRVGKPGLTCLK